MPSRPARLLCVGNEQDPLMSRCAVLGSAGYKAESASLPEALKLLRTEDFDLIIVSAWLKEWEKLEILAAAGKTPVLKLEGLTRADKLLAQVECLLSPIA
jgi:hypothetical protein